MQYLLALYVSEAGWDKLSKVEQEQGVAAYTAYTEALTKASVLKGANRLKPSWSATTVRNADNKTMCSTALDATPKAPALCSSDIVRAST